MLYTLFYLPFIFQHKKIKNMKFIFFYGVIVCLLFNIVLHCIKYHNLFNHPTTNGCLGNFHFLAIVYPFLLVYYLGSELLHHRVCMYLALLETA